MVTRLTRHVVRETAFIDHRTRKPIMIRLHEGGKLISLWPKGTRKPYMVPISSVWLLGAQIRRPGNQGGKAARRQQRKEARR